MSLTTNLIAYYEFNNGAITTDSSGNSKTLINVNTVANTASGKIGYGADFGSTNTTKNLNNSSLGANPTLPMSISTWFYPASVNDNGNIFSIADTTTPYYQLKLDSTTSHIVFRSNTTGTATSVDTGIAPSINTWYHVVVVLNSATSVTLYVNGTQTNLNATCDDPPTSTLDALFFGALGRTTPLQYYSGILDEVGVWSRVLTSAEVTQLYNGGAGNQYPFSNAYTLACAPASFSLTGESAGLGKVWASLVASVGAFSLTGFATTLVHRFNWTNQTKHSSTATNETKHSATPTNETKH